MYHQIYVADAADIICGEIWLAPSFPKDLNELCGFFAFFVEKVSIFRYGGRAACIGESGVSSYSPVGWWAPQTPTGSRGCLTLKGPTVGHHTTPGLSPGVLPVLLVSILG